MLRVSLPTRSVTTQHEPKSWLIALTEKIVKLHTNSSFYQPCFRIPTYQNFKNNSKFTREFNPNPTCQNFKNKSPGNSTPKCFFTGPTYEPDLPKLQTNSKFTKKGNPNLTCKNFKIKSKLTQKFNPQIASLPDLPLNLTYQNFKNNSKFTKKTNPGTGPAKT